MPLRPPVRNYVALGGQAASRQALAPGGSPGPAMVNQTTNNTAMVPGGSYMNGA